MRSRSIYVVLGFSVVLLGLAWWAWPRAKAVETVIVERGALAQTIVATGRVASPARVELGVPVTATIDQVLVREGDRVNAGQWLLTLRNEETDAALAQARAAVAEAQARWQQLNAVSVPVSQQTVRQAQANLKVAEADLARAQALVAQGFYSQARVDEALRARDNAQAALNTAQTQARANARDGAETQLAQARLAQAEAALRAALARAQYMRIVAPFAGTVLSRTAEPGGIAQPGRVLLTLAQQGETRLYVNVDEKNLRYLQPGFKASAVADAYPNQSFNAEVYFISPSVDALRGTVEVRLRAAEAPSFLKPDMTVSVEMIVGKKDQALRVSSDAIRNADSAQPYAWVIRDGRATRTALTLGLRGVGMVEVLSGLDEGDAVIIGTVASGAKVKPQMRAEKDKGFEPPPGMVR